MDEDGFYSAPVTGVAEASVEDAPGEERGRHLVSLLKMLIHQAGRTGLVFGEPGSHRPTSFTNVYRLTKGAIDLVNTGLHQAGVWLAGGDAGIAVCGTGGLIPGGPQ